jgi:hypothetical protein
MKETFVKDIEENSYKTKLMYILQKTVCNGKSISLESVSQ